MVNAAVSADTNLSVQILFEGAQVVLGAERMQEFRNLLPRAGVTHAPGDEAGRFLCALEARFGSPAVHGLALRIGRATFSYWLKYMGDQLGFRSQEFRLLPAPRRIEAGLQVLAEKMGVLCGESIVLSDEGQYWNWQVVNQPQPETATLCFLEVGLLQEFVSWAGGGRFYPVAHTECRAAGSPACTYRIDKRPLD